MENRKRLRAMCDVSASHHVAAQSASADPKPIWSSSLFDFRSSDNNGTEKGEFGVVKRQRVGADGSAAIPSLDEEKTVQHVLPRCNTTGTDVASKSAFHGQKKTCVDGPENPDAFIRKIVEEEFGFNIDDGALVDDSGLRSRFFDEISEEEKAAYTVDVATAARANNIDEMKRLKESGFSMNCCNRFGESLLHIACRRGFDEMAELILDQPGVCIRLSDDCGRTPLHDLCWNPTPQLKICKWILEREPSLFFIRDKRGFVPFDYARQEHWKIWKEFIAENKEYFSRLGDKCYDIIRKPRQEIVGQKG